MLVTGSDDEIFEPSRTRLCSAYNLLAQRNDGWNPATNNILILIPVILGMHAKEDNPELIKAKETRS